MAITTFLFPSLLATAVALLLNFQAGAYVAMGLTFVAFTIQTFALGWTRRRERLARDEAKAQEGQQVSVLEKARLSLEAEKTELASALLASEKTLAQLQSALSEAKSREAQGKIDEQQGVLHFVRSLQKKARLLDFAMADIHGLPDAQVGAGARVVHQGLRELFQDAFKVEPIATAAEGSLIPIPEGDARYQLLQAGSDVPEKGRLLHKGWKASAIKLPHSQRAETAEERSILAPAEIDVGGLH